MKWACRLSCILGGAIQGFYVESVTSTTTEMLFGGGISMLCSVLIVASVVFYPD